VLLYRDGRASILKSWGLGLAKRIGTDAARRVASVTLSMPRRISAKACLGLRSSGRTGDRPTRNALARPAELLHRPRLPRYRVLRRRRPSWDQMT
jgi:hypothetical protein